MKCQHFEDFFENKLDLAIELTLREYNQLHRRALSFNRCLVDMDGVVLNEVCRGDCLERILRSSWHRLG